MHAETGVLILLFVVVSLIIGAAVRHVLKGTKVPYTVVLLLVGLGVGLLERSPGFMAQFPIVFSTLDLVTDVDPHLFLFIFLPTLIFESAFSLETHLFRRMATQIAVLAIPGLVVASLLAAAFAKAAFPWEWSWAIALMFGALISATDPVAVVALLKEVSSRKRLETLIEGESLLNDGAAIVLFVLFYGLVTTQSASFSTLDVVLQFVWVGTGGLIMGLLMGWLCIYWIGRVFNDPLIEISISIAAAYLVFFLAENIHVSGVVALVAMALMFASGGRTRISPEVGEFLHHFWETMAHIANTLIFLLVGALIGYRVELTSLQNWMTLAALYAGLLVIRAGTIGLFIPLLKRIGVGITKEKAIVLSWGGLRGAVSLALAMTVAHSAAIPQAIGEQVLFLCAGIVVLSILINGGTMTMVLHKLGLDKLPAAKQATVDKAHNTITQQIKQTVEELSDNEFMQSVDWQKLTQRVDEPPSVEGETALQRDENATGTAGGLDEEQALDVAYRRRLLEIERNDYWSQYKAGILSRSATNSLVDAVEKVLDQEPILGPRHQLDTYWTTPMLIRRLRDIDVLHDYLLRVSFKRLVNSYDVARGFLSAQNEVAKSVDTLAPRPESAHAVKEELLENKRNTYARIEALRSSFPQAIQAIEAHIAQRILLNKERGVIYHLEETAVLDKPEAKRLLEDVENRMQRLNRMPIKIATPALSEVIRQASWLSEASEQTIQAVCDGAREQIFEPGELLYEQGKPADYLILISRGCVVVVDDTDGGILDVVGSGALLGMDVLDRQVADHSVRADIPTSAILLPIASVKDCLGKNAAQQLRS
jgi:NhaP-type Na+/H+ or K+/H+ antiporter